MGAVGSVHSSPSPVYAAPLWHQALLSSGLSGAPGIRHAHRYRSGGCRDGRCSSCRSTGRHISHVSVAGASLLGFKVRAAPGAASQQLVHAAPRVLGARPPPPPKANVQPAAKRPCPSRVDSMSTLGGMTTKGGGGV